MSYEAPTIYQTEQVRPNTTPEAQLPTISQENLLDAIANIRNPQLLAQLVEGAPTRYLGSINTSTARQYCKQGNRSNSLVSIDSENEVVVCKKNPIGFGYPFSIGSSTHVEEHQSNFNDVCNDLYQRYTNSRSPIMGRMTKPLTIRTPVYDSIVSSGTNCYAQF